MKIEKNYDVLVPEYNGYLEPLVAIYSRNLLAIIEVLLNRDILKIKSFFSDVNLKVIREEEISEVADPAHIFYNINYKRDLKKFCKQNEGGKL